MANTIAILLFDGAEEMDFVGPWEVFTAAVDRLTGERVMTVAETLRPVMCEKGMRVLPDATYEDARGVDVVVVPGGSGARRQIEHPATVRWLTETCAKASWITSVCTGSFLLVGCGIARGRRVTTHHNFIKALRDQGGAEVVEGVRFVRDRNVISAAGVMSGVEMSLWLVGQLYGGEVAERTKSYIAYDFPLRTTSEGIIRQPGMASDANLLMNMFGRLRGIIGRLGGIIMARMNADCGVWVAGLLEVTPDDAILEIGFGPGVIIQCLSKLASAGHTAGIDPSPEMVEQARARNAIAIKDGRVDLRRGSAESQPFADDTFDKAQAINSMQVWPASHSVNPVMLPPGRARLSVSPKATVRAQREAS